MLAARGPAGPCARGPSFRRRRLAFAPAFARFVISYLRASHPASRIRFEHDGCGESADAAHRIQCADRIARNACRGGDTRRSLDHEAEALAMTRNDIRGTDHGAGRRGIARGARAGRGRRRVRERTPHRVRCRTRCRRSPARHPRIPRFRWRSCPGASRSGASAAPRPPRASPRPRRHAARARSPTRIDFLQARTPPVAPAGRHATRVPPGVFFLHGPRIGRRSCAGL